MDKERCKLCRYFDVTSKECRRYAPRHLSGIGTGYSNEKWPVVTEDDWCGEFVPKYPYTWELTKDLTKRIGKE